MQQNKLLEITKSVISINPYPLNYWEVTAIIESLGYTDYIVQTEFGFPNVLALAQNIYELIDKEFPTKPKENNSLFNIFYTELQYFLEQFSHSFIYAIPWIAMFIFEHSDYNNKFLVLPPDLAAPLSLALMMSLIIGGGFIQIISRQGQIYINLGEIELAKKACGQFVIIGLFISIVIGFIGLLFGFYRSLFPDNYLIVSAIYYLILSLIWMLCGVISLKKPVWHIPLIFLLSGLLYVVLIYLRVSAFIGQIIALIFSLSLIFGLLAVRFKFSLKNKDNIKMQMPRIALLFYTLIPYFSYGVIYFSFLFADRISAGSAISFSSGLNFAINLEYKTGMDLALLNFLVLIAITEYMHYKFMHYWYKKTEIVSKDNIQDLSKNLYRYYFLINIAIFSLYLILGSMVISYFSNKYILTSKTIEVAIIGLVGYFIFTLGLLNSMILFSLARPILVLKAIIPGFLINLFLGYFFSHIFDSYYASLGFVLGACFFTIYSLKEVFSVLSYPDYAYYAS
ncbi:MAG: hypothetical protein HY819_13355 [Acidobacteria bacterium]|nr:hypothetical protein [Acidobacteriota bacterium]